MIHIPRKKTHITFEVPGDKSISHRAVMLGALANGVTEVEGFLPSEDCMSTILCFRQLGVEIKQQSSTTLYIHGKGLHHLQRPNSPLDVGNSGTTIRLLLGILAGTTFTSTLTGDESISRRPMDRVVHPLRKMGALIKPETDGKYTPVHVSGKELDSISYEMPIASAQVKSALLLAGIHAKGTTRILELAPSRDHTERMLKSFGVRADVSNNVVSIQGGQQGTAAKVKVPGDISSAAFLLAAGMIIPGLTVTVKNVGLNPTRTGILDVFEMMGARVEKDIEDVWGYEPVGTVTVSAESLQGIQVGETLVPRLIDEVPILAVVATQAEGETIIRNASELKVKESNRIFTIASELKRLGAIIEEREDGLRVVGRTPLLGGFSHSHRDHRIAIALSIAGLISKNPVEVIGKEVASVSFPGFERELYQLSHALQK